MIRKLIFIVLTIGVMIGVDDYLHRLPLQEEKYADYQPRRSSPFAKKDHALEEYQELKGKTAFVTGANGFLGSHVTEQLLLDGWDVIAGHRKSSDVSVLKGLKGPGKLTLVEVDITDIESIRKSIPENLDVVFNVAASVKIWRFDANQNYRVNVLGTRNVVDVCLEKNVGKLVQTSSVAVFKRIKGEHVNEEGERNLNSTFNSYAHTKYLADLEVLQGVEDGLWGVMIHPGYVIGKYDLRSFGRVVKMIENGEIPGLYESPMTTTDVVECAKAHIAAAKIGRLGNSYITGGEIISFIDLVKTLSNMLGYDKDYLTIPLEAMNLYAMILDFISRFTQKSPSITAELIPGGTTFSSVKAVKELGYNDKVPVETMLKNMVDWMREIGYIN